MPIPNQVFLKDLNPAQFKVNAGIVSIVAGGATDTAAIQALIATALDASPHPDVVTLVSEAIAADAATNPDKFRTDAEIQALIDADNAAGGNLTTATVNTLITDALAASPHPDVAKLVSDAIAADAATNPDKFRTDAEIQALIDAAVIPDTRVTAEEMLVLMKDANMLEPINDIAGVAQGYAFSVLAVTGSTANVAPVITLNGAATVSILVGDTYTEPTPTATDADGDTVTITKTGATVDTTTAGIYTVTWTATDGAGGSTSVSQIVTVDAIPDTLPPVITMTNATATINTGDVFDALTYVTSVTDNEDGVIAASALTVVNPVDTNTVGTYTVTYTATDAAGNTSSAQLDVTVVAKQIPLVAEEIVMPNPDANGDIALSFPINEANGGSGLATVEIYVNGNNVSQVWAVGASAASLFVDGQEDVMLIYAGTYVYTSGAKVEFNITPTSVIRIAGEPGMSMQTGVTVKLIPV